MTWSFLAPVLSATSIIERCCTISLERYRPDRAPALGLRERACFDEADHVADLVTALLVVDVELGGHAELLPVLLVGLHAVDADDDGLVHLRGDDHALEDPLRHFLGCHRIWLKRGLIRLPPRPLEGQDLRDSLPGLADLPHVAQLPGRDLETQVAYPVAELREHAVEFDVVL